MRDWLKKARASKGFTMLALAQKLDISESYYCMIESGNRQEHMDISLAAKLSAVLDIPIAQITALETEKE